MSNANAIAAATATLRNLIERRVKEVWPGGSVTTLPPDRARDARAENHQINLFLYQAVVSAAWRTADVPPARGPGGGGRPALALDLFYLISAYGPASDGVADHQVLGEAMGVLHDHPLLGAQEIKAALPIADLHDQIERVRITPQPLSLEEISKLWTTFQTPYRISAAYQLSVVLIESRRAGRSPLPVLTRGEADRGVAATAGLVPPTPTIAAARAARPPWGSRLGETLVVQGHHLGGAGAVARLSHLRRLVEPVGLAGPFDVQTEGEVAVELPDAEPPVLPAGVYTLALLFPDARGEFRPTNEVPVVLLPRITVTPLILVPPAAAPGVVRLEIAVVPDVQPGQSLAVLFGDRAVSLPSPDTATGEVIVEIDAVDRGEYLVRLRVDGVESLSVRYDPTRPDVPPTFDPAERVTVR